MHKMSFIGHELFMPVCKYENTILYRSLRRKNRVQLNELIKWYWHLYRATSYYRSAIGRVEEIKKSLNEQDINIWNTMVSMGFVRPQSEESASYLYEMTKNRVHSLNASIRNSWMHSRTFKTCFFLHTFDNEHIL